MFKLLRIITLFSFINRNNSTYEAVGPVITFKRIQLVILTNHKLNLLNGFANVAWMKINMLMLCKPSGELSRNLIK